MRYAFITSAIALTLAVFVERAIWSPLPDIVTILTRAGIGISIRSNVSLATPLLCSAIILMTVKPLPLSSCGRWCVGAIFCLAALAIELRGACVGYDILMQVPWSYAKSSDTIPRKAWISGDREVVAFVADLPRWFLEIAFDQSSWIAILAIFASCWHFVLAKA